MNRIRAKLQRFRRIRQLHTIISQETIKPSSPTPPHLKDHKFALIDHFATHIHMPWIFFYKNYKNGDINILKKSLSQCLTQYYPFAGRFLSPSTHHIDCNDQGVEFLEASINTSLDSFILKKEQDKTLDHLIPNGLGCSFEKTSPNMLEVQLNHFTCGGAAVAVSISHKIADGFTMLNLCNHWASVTRGLSPINPSFLNLYISDIKIPEFQNVEETFKTKYANRIFVFPNSKLNELKKKINAMGTTPVNPSRVESLTSLLFKCATTAKSGYFHPSNLYQIVNLRNKTTIADFPKLVAGNLSPVALAKMADSNQIEVITSLRKEIMKLQGVRDVKELGDFMVKWSLEFNNGCPTYACTSVCRFPFYEVDFGWGKPVRVMFRAANPGNNFVLMDTPCGDGIEATVQLEEDVMATFQHDKELLAYTQDI
ncbi:hypothetical protein SSX86_006197 [Deinandra increscens subsp. villosa]|uniref:Transferase, Chloramphenicol acetyltransferase-like domain protein n=1 Tax=Deinandra increscens subsp. villosa TaxID=3103831 RepID=A0AAP0DVA7_9ASTR